MKRNLSLLLLALCILILSSCSADIKTNKKNTDESKTNKTVIDKSKPNKEITEESKIYDQLFDLNNFVSVKIQISDEELAKIQADYEKYNAKGTKSPIYRRAEKVTITIGDQVYEIEDVGVRMKGNTSRTDFYSKEKGVYNIINLKLSFD